MSNDPENPQHEEQRWATSKDKFKWISLVTFLTSFAMIYSGWYFSDESYLKLGLVLFVIACIFGAIYSYTKL